MSEIESSGIQMHTHVEGDNFEAYCNGDADAMHFDIGPNWVIIEAVKDRSTAGIKLDDKAADRIHRLLGEVLE